MPDPAPAPVCLCVHGMRAPSAQWWQAVRAQLPQAATLALIGDWAAASPLEAALRLDPGPAADIGSLARQVAAHAAGQHLVLVRSDADLTDAAIARLLRALDEADILCASALDGLEPERSPLAAGSSTAIDTVHLDALCQRLGQGRLLDVARPSPLASAWHGERLADADSVQRFRQVLLDHLFVGAADARPVTAPADSDARDPLPPSPLAALREAIVAAGTADAMLADATHDARPLYLHILHGWGGGAERWVRDFCKGCTSARHLVLIARGSHQRRRHGEWLELRDGSFAGPPLRRIALPVPIADTARHEGGYQHLLGELIETCGVDALIVSSLIGHSLDVLRTGLPTLRVIHDHYPLWPVLHRDFGDASLRFDRAQLESDLAAEPADRLFTETSADHWQALRDAFVTDLTMASVTLIAPSRSALAHELRLAPELARLRQAVIGHGLAPFTSGDTSIPAPPQRRRLRVVLPGRIRHGKGAQLLNDVLPRLRERADVFLLGAGVEAEAWFGVDGVHILLDYRREDLPGLIARLAPDLAMLLPTVAETFGYLLSELRALGLPVLATGMGAYAERIEDGVDGFLASANADAVLARFAEIDAERESLDGVRRTLATRREPDLGQMAAAYALHLPSLPRRPHGPRLQALDLASQHAAALHTEACRLAEANRKLSAELAAALAENERRGQWGHDLNRQIAGANVHIAHLEKEYAAKQLLEAEVLNLRPLLTSRSWRYTQPLRTLAIRLRDLRASLAFRRQRLFGLARRVRGSLAQHGLRGTWQRILRELRGKAPPAARQTWPEPSTHFAPFAVPCSDAPKVSIIIPVHNKFAYTAACLRSLAAEADATPIEVVVVDDLSNDETPARLASIDGVRVLRNEVNLGFVGSCNAGAAMARGEFVFFLNNDTLVTPGWLAALLRVFDEEADAGLVGAQLVYPDGRLQEAGGIIFSDASGWNYGRFEDPDDCRFAFRREADYCSGAAILLRRSLFERLGRFDARYAPAYYEDTDLAFTVRAAGLKVFYEPRARVVHFEGITAGTDTGSGMKRYQVINQDKFRAKWQAELEHQPRAGSPIHLAATARARKRVLIIDATTPTPDQDSGSLRMLNLMRILRRMGCHVVFMPANLAHAGHYTTDLQALGIEVLHHPCVHDVAAWFRERGKDLDAIILSRHYIARDYIGLARLYASRARLVFDTVDLHYLREQRAAELEGNAELARVAAGTRTQEIGVMRACDLTLVVSPVEKNLLAGEVPDIRVEVLSNVHEVFGCRRSFAERGDLLFIGGFQHPPNIDAMLWFVGEVLPLVHKAIPDLRLHIIGSKLTPEVAALASERVIVHGYVEDIAPALDAARISIAPLRYGAGVKGKVNMAMSYGLPVVATPAAVEGMHVRNGEDVLVADSAAEFAAAIIALHGDAALWQKLSNHGLDNVRRHFSFEAAEQAIRRILPD